MGRFLAYRFLALIASLVLASAVIFVVLRQLPGDAGGATLGVGTTADQLAQLRADLGTDLPVWQQYTTWIASLFDGSTTSFISRSRSATLLRQNSRSLCRCPLQHLLLQCSCPFPWVFLLASTVILLSA